MIRRIIVSLLVTAFLPTVSFIQGAATKNTLVDCNG